MFLSCTPKAYPFIMKYIGSVILLLLLFGSSSLKAQFPALEMSADQVVTPGGTTVDVSVRAGQNWQNITTINGTINFDTTIITYSQMSFWGLSFPQGATFTYQGGGVLTWTWTSLITIGPTLNQGDVVFTLQFNVVGAAGTVSPVNFVSSPEPLYWFNGFGWSGNNFALTQGSVTVLCGGSGSNWAANDSLLNVDFQELAGPSATAFLWDFGDGNTSTQPNPNHVYTTPGQYTVCLTVTDSCGTDSTCQTINVCPTPSATFSSQANLLNYDFTADTNSTATNWLWDFGDGNTSTQQNPNHTYTTPGTYTVCLTANNACGTDSTCSSVTVVCPVPQAAFSESSNELAYTFTDQTSNAPTSWLWDFGDGNTSSMQNPTHTYAAPGNYTVCLTTSSSCGTDSTCSVLNATCTAPSANFSETTIGLIVQFGDLSTQGATSWLWDFGDGATSTLQSPSHTYMLPGTYNVCLTATSICGSDSICQNITVTCPAPMADFSYVITGSTVTFSDLSTQGPTSWDWDFGDGNTSGVQSPTHTYASDGTYLVCLISTSLCGSDSTCDTVVINTVGREELAQAGFQIYPNPSSGLVAVQVDAHIAIQVVRVMDLRGKVLALFPGQNNNVLQLDLSSMAAGLKFVEVETENGRAIGKLLIE